MATYDTYVAVDIGGVFSIDFETSSKDTVTDQSGNTTILGDVSNDQFTVTNGSGVTDTYTYAGTVYDHGKAIGFVSETTDAFGVKTYAVFVPHGTEPPIFFDAPAEKIHHGQDWSLASNAPVCFMAGTLVSTPGGAVPIESLTQGDMVSTHAGASAPVRWLGRQTVSSAFADPLTVLPIRIQAGALGDDLPLRDLLVSPEHAIMIQGVLVQAGALVNGVTIRRETDVAESFVYYHVELADHSLILAENVPAESFIDNVDRRAFDNWNEHPQAAPLVEMALPRAKSHRQVPLHVRQLIESRLPSVAIAA